MSSRFINAVILSVDDILAALCASRPNMPDSKATHSPKTYEGVSRDFLEKLISDPMILYEQDDYGRMAIHRVCEEGSLFGFTLYYGLGCDPAIKDIEGRTCLHLACRSGDVEVCRAILSLCDQRTLNAMFRVDNNNMTPLHYVSQHASLSSRDMILICRMLLSSGMQIQARGRTENSTTALSMSNITGHKKGHRCLKKLHAEIDQSDFNRVECVPGGAEKYKKKIDIVIGTQPKMIVCAPCYNSDYTRIFDHIAYFPNVCQCTRINWTQLKDSGYECVTAAVPLSRYGDCLNRRAFDILFSGSLKSLASYKQWIDFLLKKNQGELHTGSMFYNNLSIPAENISSIYVYVVGDKVESVYDGIRACISMSIVTSTTPDKKHSVIYFLPDDTYAACAEECAYMFGLAYRRCLIYELLKHEFAHQDDKLRRNNELLSDIFMKLSRGGLKTNHQEFLRRNVLYGNQLTNYVDARSRLYADDKDIKTLIEWIVGPDVNKQKKDLSKSKSKSKSQRKKVHVDAEYEEFVISAMRALIMQIHTALPMREEELKRHISQDEPHCLKAMLDAASQGNIRLYREISICQVKRDYEPFADGADAVVYRGTWTPDGDESRVIVIKEAKDAEPNTLKSILMEASYMSVLSHPNLIEFYGAVTEGIHYVIMEFMDCGSLFNYIQTHAEQDAPQFPWPSRLSILRDIIEGMKYMHACGILHRDLKSLNVLVSKTGVPSNPLVAKISDYGTCIIDRRKELGPQNLEMVGTRTWMAPEVALRSKTYDAKADVYSFAIIMYELAELAIPFADINMFDFYEKVFQKGERPTFSKESSASGHPAYYKNWTALATRCWDKRPKKRYTFEDISILVSKWC